MSKKLPKRIISQIVFFLAQNPLLNNFISGTIYQGDFKKFCTPGLNCYSCPAAVLSCPLGSMQLFLAGAKQSIGVYVAGFLLSTGVVFGRFICGYVCPMGLLQDLIHKIKSPKVNTGLRFAKYLKYIVLMTFVLLLPLLVRHELSGLGEPWFCKYICPSGTVFAAFPLMAANGFLRAMAGALFTWKAALAVCIMLISVVIYRFFCRVLCPLGAIYSLFNKFAFIRMHHHKPSCVSCGVCRDKCPVIIDPVKQTNSPECIRCGKCISACSTKALGYRRK